MTTMMILRRCVVSAFLVFFSRIRLSFCISQKNTTKKRDSSSSSSSSNASSFSCKRTKEKKKKISLARKNPLVVLLIKDKEEISRRRDFLFLFFFEQGGKKKIHSRQESFHLLQKRARALKEHRHTRAHKTREREKDDAFFFFSDIVVCLFCVRIICEDHREREREKTFYHLASDKREREQRDYKREEKTLTSSCF